VSRWSGSNAASRAQRGMQQQQQQQQQTATTNELATSAHVDG